MANSTQQTSACHWLEEMGSPTPPPIRQAACLSPRVLGGHKVSFFCFRMILILWFSSISAVPTSLPVVICTLPCAFIYLCNLCDYDQLVHPYSSTVWADVLEIHVLVAPVSFWPLKMTLLAGSVHVGRPAAGHWFRGWIYCWIPLPGWEALTLPISGGGELMPYYPWAVVKLLKTPLPPFKGRHNSQCGYRDVKTEIDLRKKCNSEKT